MLDGYRRSTRYERIVDGSPMMLAMHEMDSTATPPNVKLAVSTEWAKKIRGAAISSSTEYWEFIAEYGKGEKGEIL